MLDIGFIEILLIGALALIVVGPKDLPGLLRTVGQFVGKAKAMARDFQNTMEDAAREADMGDVADVVKGKKKLNALPFDTQVVDSLKEFEKSVKTEVGDAARAAETSLNDARTTAEDGGGNSAASAPPVDAAGAEAQSTPAEALVAAETPINAPADAPRMTPDSGKADPSTAPASATKSA